MIKIQLAQINCTVGDISGNCEKIITACQQAQQQRVDILAFPELAISGYPAEDLLLRRDFIDTVNNGLQRILPHTQGLTVVVGLPHQTDDGLFNAAAIVQDSNLLTYYHKQLLPNYGVFDEQRYFKPGNQACIIQVKEIPIAITICEDLWQADVCQQAKIAGAQAIISINASPFDYTKAQHRQTMFKQRCQENHLPIFYVNLIGGQDELIFDGGSMIIDAKGDICQAAPYFQEDYLTLQWSVAEKIPATDIPVYSKEKLIYDALVLGTRDYLEKNRINGVLLGLSGGIDSALVLAIAVDAIGADRVQAVLMPSSYTATMSNEDAQTEATTLGVKYSMISIQSVFNHFLGLLSEEFHGLSTDTTEENLQARCRGIILMALSNKTGKLVLTTSNKSETAVGYATLYGDMAGGLAILKDVAKTLVYQLARYRNSIAPIIPERVFTRPPSAELAANQTDQDNLPTYDVLDEILQRYVEADQSRNEIIAAGFSAEVVDKVICLVKYNEYKRRQAAPGIRVTPRAFGKDRRYPITSKF